MARTGGGLFSDWLFGRRRPRPQAKPAGGGDGSFAPDEFVRFFRGKKALPPDAFDNLMTPAQRTAAKAGGFVSPQFHFTFKKTKDGQPNELLRALNEGDVDASVPLLAGEGRHGIGDAGHGTSYGVSTGDRRDTFDYYRDIFEGDGGGNPFVAIPMLTRDNAHLPSSVVPSAEPDVTKGDWAHILSRHPNYIAIPSESRDDFVQFVLSLPETPKVDDLISLLGRRGMDGFLVHERYDDVAVPHKLTVNPEGIRAVTRHTRFGPGRGLIRGLPAPMMTALLAGAAARDGEEQF